MIVTYRLGYYLAVNDFGPSIRRRYARTLAAAHLGLARCYGYCSGTD